MTFVSQPRGAKVLAHERIKPVIFAQFLAKAIEARLPVTGIAMEFSTLYQFEANGADTLLECHLWTNDNVYMIAVSGLTIQTDFLSQKDTRKIWINALKIFRIGIDRLW